MGGRNSKSSSAKSSVSVRVTYQPGGDHTDITFSDDAETVEKAVKLVLACIASAASVNVVVAGSGTYLSDPETIDLIGSLLKKHKNIIDEPTEVKSLKITSLNFRGDSTVGDVKAFFDTVKSVFMNCKLYVPPSGEIKWYHDGSAAVYELMLRERLPSTMQG